MTPQDGYIKEYDMHQYIALTWPRSDIEKTQAARTISHQLLRGDKHTSHWQVAAQGPGLLVLQKGDIPGQIQAYPLDMAEQKHPVIDVNDTDNYCNGVILGKLFPKSYIDHYQPGDPAPEDPVICISTSRKIIESGGSYLIDNYWGRYVAVIYDRATDSHHVLSDPTWGIPCYYTEHRGVQLYFSDITSCDLIEDLDFTINWNNVHKRMIGYLTQTEDTGLTNVYKLLPGQCRTTSIGQTGKRFYWNPICFARRATTQTTHPTKHIDTTAAELRRITMGCINAWASCYRHIILSLSGGLDSTIILGCLLHANPAPQITGLNYFDAGSDERRFARLAADFAGIDLIEEPSCIRDITRSDLDAMPRTAKLTGYHYGLYFAPFVSELSDKLNADAIFIGQGGDELFYAPHTPFFALDYVRRHGFLSPGFPAVAMNAALITKVSLKEILQLAWKDRVRKPVNPYHLFDRSTPSTTINPEIRKNHTPRDNFHPILKEAEDLPPGKFEHLLSLLSPYLEHPPVQPEHHLEKCLPLYSQPLIEHCLELPTYSLAAHGKSRGLARQAFSQDIPLEIASRESKGTGTRHHQRVFENTRELSREFLLEGEMVKNNLLDRDRLIQALGGNLAEFDFHLLTIKSYLSTESWLRKWIHLSP